MPGLQSLRCHPGGATYEVQVSTTAEFTNIVETSPRVDQTTYTAKTKTYPEGPLFWRVRAYDAQRQPPHVQLRHRRQHRVAAAGLQRLRVQKDVGRIDPDAAANRATVNSAPVMAWDAMPYAKTYQVEVYKSPDSALNPTNRVAPSDDTRDRYQRSHVAASG